MSTKYTFVTCFVLLITITSCNFLINIHQVSPDPDPEPKLNLTEKDFLSKDYLTDITSRTEVYKSRYGVECVQDKVTDNKGEGFDALYGTRNFRVVLHGVAYRGGGNNYYHNTNKRGNKNPLPLDGLNALSENGFSTSIYLYKTNFETAPSFIYNEANTDTLHYYQIGGDTDSELDSIIQLTYKSIVDVSVGPVYLHCWNGWHQSGFVSAVLLKQFCDFSNEKSIHYWEDCADNWINGYDRIRNSIRDFVPKEKYNISDEVKSAICPCYNDNRVSDTSFKLIENDVISPNVSFKFSSNTADLSPSVSTFLDEYSKMLQNNPFVYINIAGHTDSKGSDESNKILSENRALSVFNYLLKSGVDSLQLSYEGHGEEDLVNGCNDDVNCSEKLHAENRRIDLSITHISCNINFIKGSAEINKEDKLLLSKVGQIISKIDNKSFEIGGHADGGSGDDFVNDNLSLLRAERVYNFLKNIGIDMSLINYVGYGSRHQIYGDTRDRRIEFKMIEHD
jgi:outer membrane protein OmpA-like peptidoglycan-associated protein